MRNVILLIIFVISLFSCSQKQETEAVQKKEISENLWVCRNYKCGLEKAQKLGFRKKEMKKLPLE
jgi:hypothetical protein